jgi:membrane-associated phospholipid phosphatase
MARPIVAPQSTGTQDAAGAEPPQRVVQRGRRFFRLYLGLLVSAAVAFGGLVFLVRDRQEALLRFDERISRAVQGVNVPGYGWVLTHVSDFGYPPLDVVCYVGVFVAFCAVRRYREAALAVVSSLLAGLVGAGIRELVGRQRPSATLVRVVRHINGYGFPSGHVIQYVTLFGFACYVVLVTWRGGVPRAVIATALAVLVVLVGPSRVYLGAHWPSDTLGAYLLAGLWLAGTIEVHLAIERRMGAARGPAQPGTTAVTELSGGAPDRT